MRRSILLRIAYPWPRQRPGLPIHPHPPALQLARVAQWFHALSDTTRLDILALLSQRDRSAGELTVLMDVPASRVSFHLKVLRESGVIREHRDGPSRFSIVRGDTLDLMIDFTRTLMPGAHVGRCPLHGCRD